MQCLGITDLSENEKRCQKRVWITVQMLTVKERMEEKNVPSSYRESLDNTPSKTAANCESQEEMRA